MKPKNNKNKRHKHVPTTLLTVVRRGFQFVYAIFWNFFKPWHVPFKKSKWNEVQMKKMNNIMSRFYKRKQLMINDFENVDFFDFESTDGTKLSGITYSPNKDSDKWVISFHWFAGDKFFGLYHARFLTEMGYNVMSFDFRGHGQSENDTSTMGVKESRDAIAAIEWLTKHKSPEQIVVLGTSMGAYVTNFLSFYYPSLPEDYKVKFGIYDCGFGSVETLYMHFRNLYLRFIPKRLTKQAVNHLLDKSNKVDKKDGIDIHGGNVFKLIEQGDKPGYPIFFNHAKNDMVTPAFDTMQLVEARKDLIDGDEYNLYNYCMHTQALRTHFKSYVNNVTKFVANKDNNQEQYQELVQKWELDKITSKKDLNDERLS
ncbi:alpha/beta hydrolase [Mesoplasma lactucae]|uniref:Uncharacterized protein n=1 Tax=Mesoplasma lactucae ATCC 49193 TaxID=81460 RepID=A0A291IRY3_9MOLU|nr:alpha/beta fold hydrolase [Mesoplasma lactucae]ATG97685.1 hypothetical protein CP520_03015 [Mesoplasma lactucae ATCC 49193]ATZ19850.1 alpha/beta hydrolase [Mesoplasma lactucae ATCC 49193]MCL8216713.1 hypothetical protein [Mesoplasma lactucae ATCC 49193]